MDLKRSWKYGEESYILKTAESSYSVGDEKKYVLTEKAGIRKSGRRGSKKGGEENKARKLIEGSRKAISEESWKVSIQCR